MFLTNIVFKYLSVYLASLVKFIGGILLGVAEGLTVIETATFTFLGAMTTILVVVLIGNRYRAEIGYLLTKIKQRYYLFIISIIQKLGLFSEETRANRINNIRNKMEPKRFSKTIRIVLKTWRRFGIFGIAILTPLILSPIGGAVIAVSFRVKTRKVILNMIISHVIFSLLFAYVFVEFKDLLEERLNFQFHSKH